MRFRIKNFKSCQILKQKFYKLSDFESNFYNASDFKTNFLRRVRFWIRNFTTRQVLRKDLLLKSPVFKKKFFSKSEFWEKTCTQKIKNHILVQFTP